MTKRLAHGIIGGNRRYLGRKVKSCLMWSILLEPRDLWVGLYHHRFRLVSGGKPRITRTFYLGGPILVLKLDLTWYGPWPARWSESYGA